MQKMRMASQILLHQLTRFKAGAYLCWNFLSWSETWARGAQTWFHLAIISKSRKKYEGPIPQWRSHRSIPDVCYLNWVLQHHIWMTANHMKTQRRRRSPARIWALSALKQTTAKRNEDGKSAQGWDSRSRGRMRWKILMPVVSGSAINITCRILDAWFT